MNPTLAGTSDRDPLSYRAGERMVFSLRAENAPAGSRLRWLRTGDDGRIERGETPLRAAASQPLSGASRLSGTSCLSQLSPEGALRPRSGHLSGEAALTTALGPRSGHLSGEAALTTALGPRSGHLSGEAALKNLTTALDRPGFVRLRADLIDAAGNAVAHFEGGAAAEADAIRADAPEPPDLDAFWARRKAALAAVPMDGATCRPIDSPSDAMRIFEVSIPCPGGRPSTGLLSVPARGGRFPARVRFRGYQASWSELAWKTPPREELPDDAIVLFLSAHGFAFNRDPGYYAALRAASGSNGWDVAFDPVQNAAPGTAYFGGMSWRVLRGLEYLKSRPEWDGANLLVFGGSMGGLQAIWAAALDPAVTECRPRIPWCCNMAGPASGRAHGDWFVPWVPALAYYDPANLARRIPATCRVVVPEAGLGDYISPPSGVMAFYNALSCPKEITFVQGAMHFTFPPDPWQTAFRTAH